MSKPSIPTSTSPSTSTLPAADARRRISTRTAAAAAAAVAIVSATAVWAFPTGASPAKEPARSQTVDASVARYADSNGLSGLSPASLAPVLGCRGLSLASATDCSADELLRMFCAGTPSGEVVCAGNRP
jgi:hypothetical protein